MYFCYFIIISPWKRAGCLHLYKLGSPSPKDVLCQVWLKLVQWFLRRFLNFVNVFLLFHNIISLWKTWIPFTKECIMPSLVEIGPVVLVKKIFLIFVNIFLLFSYDPPFEKGGSFIWPNLNCQVWLKVDEWICRLCLYGL